MILASYRIAPSHIAGAGKGVLIEQDIAAGRIIVAPDAITQTTTWAEINKRADAAKALAASVRWFEDHFTVSMDWPDECYINHSFEANGLWHLGFVFAARDISAGEELLIDYRHLLPEGEIEVFNDSDSNTPIVGYSWAESLKISTQALLHLVK